LKWAPNRASPAFASNHLGWRTLLSAPNRKHNHRTVTFDSLDGRVAPVTMSSHRRTPNHFIEIMSSDDEGDDDLLLGRGSVFSRPFRAVSGGGQPPETKPSALATTRTPPPSALPSSSSSLGTTARSGSGNGTAATEAAATFTASAAAAAATVTTPTSLVHTTPIGFVDFDYVSNESKGRPGDAVIINRERDVRWIPTVDAWASSAHRSHSLFLGSLRFRTSWRSSWRGRGRCAASLITTRPGSWRRS
jgi:hypothetical protein